MSPEDVSASRYGCGATAARHSSKEHPKHVIDQEYYAREGAIVALCGAALVYVDGATVPHEGYVASGREVVSTRTRSCRRCNRIEVERGTDRVLIPLRVLQLLRGGAQWSDVEVDIDERIKALLSA